MKPLNFWIVDGKVAPRAPTGMTSLRRNAMKSVAMNAEERDAFFDDVVRAVTDGKMTWGEVVRSLRTDVAGVNQATFARMTKISERALRQLETDVGNPTLATLGVVLKPFGLSFGLRRRR